MYRGEITLSDGTVLTKVGTLNECLSWAESIRSDIDYNVIIDIKEVKYGA